MDNQKVIQDSIETALEGKMNCKVHVVDFKQINETVIALVDVKKKGRVIRTRAQLPIWILSPQL